MKTDNVKIDSYDRRILFELDKNARITTTAIGKTIRKSKQFVDYRIKKLEAEGILKGYVGVIDYSKLGYIGIRVYFNFHNLTPTKQKEIEDSLIENNKVWWLVSLEGKWDIGYALALKNMLDFYPYWEKVMKKYRKYISKRSIVAYTHIKQYPKSYLINKDNNHEGTLVGESVETVSVDAMDLRLLKLISDKGRMSLLDLSTKLKTSPQVVRGHMKKLEKLGVIQGYKALINVAKLGYRYYKSYINLVNLDNLGELENYCMKNPNILNINKTIGGHDFEIELQAKSFDEFEDIMDDMRTKFSEMIEDYEFVVAREEKKMVYFPFE